MLIKYFTLSLFISILHIRYVQAQELSYVKEGKITFERRINVHKTFELLLTENKNVKQDMVPKLVNDYKAGHAQFSTRKFTLSFNNNISLFQPSDEAEVNPINFLNQAAHKNTVFSDLASMQATTEKKFYDHAVIIKDSLRKIRWRLTDETRMIENYLCRRANAVIMDSVYVVAYYTDQIIPKSGPESFNGLPGMILGLALPEQHITWFAVNVSTEPQQQLKKGDLPQQHLNEKGISQSEYISNTKKFLDQHLANTPWFLDLLSY